MRRLFRLSEAAALGLHAAALLADRPDGLTTTAEISARLAASHNHLSKVMQRLNRAGIVSSVRGPHGGFRLVKAAADTTLLEVFEAVEGPVDVSGCLFDRPVCDGRFCVFGSLLQRLEAETREFLQGTSLADVAAGNLEPRPDERKEVEDVLLSV